MTGENPEKSGGMKLEAARPHRAPLAGPTSSAGTNSPVREGISAPADRSPRIGESRRERKKRALRAQIYRAAVDLFMSEGYEAATIERIAEAADISRATFFNYYRSKDAVLHEIAREAVDYAKRIFEREFRRKSGPVAGKIKTSLKRFALVVERNPKYYKNVFLDVMGSQLRLTGPNSPGPRELIDALAGHLRREQERGELEQRLDPNQLAEMLTGIYMYTILSGILRGLPESLVERMDRAVEIFLRGCLPQARMAPERVR